MAEKLKTRSDSGYESARPLDHKNATALSILADLKETLEACEKQDFRFLSYLLRMAVLEAQSIARESREESIIHPANSKSRH